MIERRGTVGTPNHFDRAGPFYPLVVQYLVSLHGMIELLSRDLARKTQRVIDAGHNPREDGPTEGDHIVEEYLADPAKRTTTHLFKPLSLSSTGQEKPIDIDPDELAAELFDEHHYLLPWIARAGGTLLIMAWEVCREHTDNGPLPEFLRHCRNAAGHGSRFNFLGEEPRRRAEWAGLVIERSLQGTPLFQERGRGFLMMGDPIRLLWDIEQAHPDIPPDLTPYRHETALSDKHETSIDP